MDDVVIKVENISKVFMLPHEKHSSLKSAFIHFYRRRRYEKQQALKDISFEVKKGEFFGIVGRNGSGKSTLLRLIAGIYTPTKGAIWVNGKLTPFIELGVGFNPELTGRENVFLNGALLGLNRRETQAMYRDIVEFAELDDFMDQKLKNYSSGMQVRLAFSIAIRAKSDILLIDEVLAVGDAAFQQKCYDYFRKLKKDKKNVVFVSHDLNSVQEFCDRAAIIDGGVLKNIGGASEIVRRYETIVADTEPTPSPKQTGQRPGTGDAVITRVRLLDKNKKTTSHINEGEPFTIEVSFLAKKTANVVVGLGISDQSGAVLFGPNTQEEGLRIKLKANDRKTINATFTENHLAADTYLITAGIFNERGLVPFDYFEAAAKFKILGERRHGKINSRPKWSLN